MMRNASQFWLGNLKGRDHSEDLGVGGRIILKCVFRKWVWRVGFDSSGSG
jgi:hypothetical protein